MSVVNAIPLIAAGDDGYSLSRSLRFRQSATAYLSRTYATPTSTTIGTISFWYKRGLIGNSDLVTAFGTVSTTTGNGPYLQFTTNGALRFVDQSSDVITSAFFRDPAAWYHFVLAIDTTQATAANRLKFYVNGVQITSFSSATYGAQNYASNILASGTQYIGYSQPSNARGSDGYMAEVNFIDGQALTPSSFGAYSIYNQWLPKKYAGTYGTNGFYLPFTNNASTTTLGYDFSPQGNNWTTNNISVTAGSTYDSMTDVPTLTSATAANYAVLNPLDKGTTITVQSGNLEASISTTHNGVRNTFQVPTTGKWYWEITNGSTTGSNVILSFGLATSVASMNTYDYNTTGTYSLYASTNLQIISNGSGGITFGSAISSGTVCGIAYDATNGQLYLAVANTYYNSAGSGTGDPAGGTNATMAVASSLGLFPYEHIYADTFNANFGQRPFTYTPPSGYVALNTFNL